MKPEELIIKAKQRYPIGTEVSNDNLNKGCNFTITEHKFEFDGADLLVRANYNHITIRYTIYSSKLDKWAEILRYPAGYAAENKIITDFPIF